MSGIYAAMNSVMADVQSVGKDQRNAQQGFNFRGVDAVVNAVGPRLREHGVIVVPAQVTDVVHERYQTSGGTWMDGVTLRIVWRFFAADGSFIEAASAGQASDAGDKAVSKAHSVAYRTVLLQALCIPTDEPDPDESTHERGASAAPDPLKAAFAGIVTEGERLGWSKDDIAGDFAAAHEGLAINSADLAQALAYLDYLKAVPNAD